MPYEQNLILLFSERSAEGEKERRRRQEAEEKRRRRQEAERRRRRQEAERRKRESVISLQEDREA